MGSSQVVDGTMNVFLRMSSLFFAVVMLVPSGSWKTIWMAFDAISFAPACMREHPERQSPWQTSRQVARRSVGKNTAGQRIGWEPVLAYGSTKVIP